MKSSSYEYRKSEHTNTHWGILHPYPYRNYTTFRGCIPQPGFRNCIETKLATASDDVGE